MISRAHVTRTLLLLLAAVAVSPASAQERRAFEIGILVDKIIPEMAPVLDELQSEIVSVVGQDAEIRFPEELILSNEYDITVGRANYDRALQSDADLILAFGPVNNEIISSRTDHPKPTVLFGALNRDLIPIDPRRTTSGISNFTYLITTHSYADDLTMLKSLADFEHVGVVALGPLGASQDVAAALERAVSRLDAEYTLIPYTNVESVASRLDDVDALYLAEGFGIPSVQMQEIADLLLARGIPSFTNTLRADVEAGWLATAQADDNFEQFIRRIALTVDAVVNGADMAELPIRYDQPSTLTINFNTLERIGLSIRYSLLGSVDLVGDFDQRVAEDRYTLREVINRALENNLSIRASRLDPALALQELRDARSTFLPSASASATSSYTDPELARVAGGQNPEYATSGNLTVTQTLFSDAGKAGVAIQRDLLEASQEDLAATELDLVLDVASLYFNLLSLKANLQIQHQNLDATRRNLRIATQNFEAGESGESDVLRFRSELARNTQALIDAIHAVEQGFQQLNLLMGDAIGRKVDILDLDSQEMGMADAEFEGLRVVLDDPSERVVLVDFLVEEALANAPELRSLDYALDATERSVRISGFRRYLPTVAAQAQYNRTFDQSGVGSVPSDVLLKDNYVAGLSLSIPLFDSGREKVRRQKALLDRDRLETNRQGLVLAIEQRVRSAVLDLSGQLSGIELSELTVQAARRGLELTEAAYSGGAVNVVQLIDAQNNLLQAQLAQANATYGFLASAYALQREVGVFWVISGETEPMSARFLNYLERRQN